MSWKNNQIRGFIAIYLAGKLRDTEMAETLMDLVMNPEEFDRPAYHIHPKVEEQYARTGYHDTYYQFVSHSIRALIWIGEEVPHLRTEISRVLKAVKEKEFPGAPAGKAVNAKSRDAYFDYVMTEAVTLVIERTLTAWEE